MRRRRGMREPEVLPKGKAAVDLELILREIEKEAVPERLLELALRLQAALTSQRANEPGMEDD